MARANEDKPNKVKYQPKERQRSATALRKDTAAPRKPKTTADYPKPQFQQTNGPIYPQPQFTTILPTGQQAAANWNYLANQSAGATPQAMTGQQAAQNWLNAQKTAYRYPNEGNWNYQKRYEAYLKYALPAQSAANAAANKPAYTGGGSSGGSSGRRSGGGGGGGGGWEDYGGGGGSSTYMPRWAQDLVNWRI